MRRPINPAWRKASLPQDEPRATTEPPDPLAATAVSDRTNEPAIPGDDLRHLPSFGGGRYAIGRELGRGSMGVVYEAEDKMAARPVALKVLAGDRTDQGLVDRFLVEAKIGLSLVDEHVCRLYDVGVDQATKRPFMAMELLRGRDLDALLTQNRRRMSLEDACAHVMAASAGLATAHARGIVHLT
ncbi:MAG: protein kinase [Deltaproteobacteria bacterium]|nr:protein kinase [Deltaproteobacteria bacterium]